MSLDEQVEKWHGHFLSGAENMDIFVLSPLPIESGATSNEHRLSVPERLMLVRTVSLELKESVVERMTLTVPTLTVHGTKFVFMRAPTDQEITAVRTVADYYGCALTVTIRSDSEYQHERRVAAARRTGKWSS